MKLMGLFREWAEGKERVLGSKESCKMTQINKSLLLEGGIIRCQVHFQGSKEKQ
jgi:hypothetical protein